MDVTQLTALIAGLIGLVIPVVISVTKQAGLNKWWNLLIAAATCGIAGFITVWARGELQWGNWVAMATIIFAESQAVYAAFWKDSGLDMIIDRMTSLYRGKPKE